MMKKNLAMRCTLSLGLVTLLGCMAAANSPTVQSNTIHNSDESEITSSPPVENPQVDGGIDYKNAKPMPLPSVPTPPNLEAQPGAPSTGTTQDAPCAFPGSAGSGEQKPQVLIPADESETTSSPPGENPQVDGGIDYKNAKPMPLPSLPTPPHLEAQPGAPSTGTTQAAPCTSPGSAGSGEQKPQVLIPSKPQAE